MPRIEVDIDEMELFDAVEPDDAVSHWGPDELLEQMDLDDVRDFAIKNCRAQDILSQLDDDDIVKYLQEIGYKVEVDEDGN